jgi:hypothetical protein
MLNKLMSGLLVEQKNLSCGRETWCCRKLNKTEENGKAEKELRETQDVKVKEGSKEGEDRKG